jgi:hypothetical protein
VVGGCPEVGASESRQRAEKRQRPPSGELADAVAQLLDIELFPEEIYDVIDLGFWHDDLVRYDEDGVTVACDRRDELKWRARQSCIAGFDGRLLAPRFEVDQQIEADRTLFQLPKLVDVAGDRVVVCSSCAH